MLHSLPVNKSKKKSTAKKKEIYLHPSLPIMPYITENSSWILAQLLSSMDPRIFLTEEARKALSILQQTVRCTNSSFAFCLPHSWALSCTLPLETRAKYLLLTGRLLLVFPVEPASISLNV